MADVVARALAKRQVADVASQAATASAAAADALAHRDVADAAATAAAADAAEAGAAASLAVEQTLSVRQDFADVATYTGSDIIPLVADTAGTVALGVNPTTGYLVAKINPDDPSIASGVAEGTAGLVSLAKVSTVGSVVPILVDRNGRIALGVDIATGAIVPGASGGVADPVYATLTVFGDSFTAGVGASTDANRYANKVAAAWGATLSNQAVSGTVLQNSADLSGSPRANNGRGRFVGVLTGANIRAAAIIAYGFNDARYVDAPSTLNVANYENDLAEVIAGLITRGYRPEDITIAAPWYITDTGLVTGSTGFAGQTRAGFEAFVTAARQVASDFGTYYYDAYAYMRDNGGAALIDTDNIHPNDSGHAAIALGLRTTRRIINQRLAPTGLAASSPGTGQLALAWTAVFGAVSYEHQYSAGSDVWAAATTGTGATASWTGLAAGNYLTRTRAVFGDGAKSPWRHAPAVAVS